MTIAIPFRSRRSASFFRSLATITLLTSALVACSNADVDIDGLAVVPDTANKGETLHVEGTVTSAASLSSVDVQVLDEHDAPLPDSAGITIANNAFPGDKISWDLRKDAELKIVTSHTTPSGTYKIRVEGATDKK